MHHILKTYLLECDDNFKSKTGLTCAGYVSNAFCTPDGGYGSGWSHELHGVFSDWKDPATGLDATACTACGCGRNQTGKSENFTVLV